MTIKEQVLSSPCTRYWLRDAITQLDDKDPVDALHDVETLLEIIKDTLKH